MAPKKPDPDDSGWLKQLLLGLGALIVVAGLVGGVIAVVLVKAVDVSGLGDAAEPSPSGDPDIPVVVSPTPTPTPSATASAGSTSASPSSSASQSSGEASPSPEKSASATPDKKADDKSKKKEKKQKQDKKAGKLTLTAKPTSASTWARVTLVGSFPGHDGATLQVQRNIGSGWSDFPVTAEVHGGHYDTYVQSGRSGVNKFRMVAVDSGKTSNVVTVTLH